MWLIAGKPPDLQVETLLLLGFRNGPLIIPDQRSSTKVFLGKIMHEPLLTR